MKITNGDLPTTKAPAEWFTGDVYVDNISMEGSGLNAALVHFTPSARTGWHRHPLGQTLYILEVEGRVQRDGGPVDTVRAGDVVFFEPDEHHWHGAAPHRFMTHVAMVRLPADGDGTNWGRLVTDAEYHSGPKRPSIQGR